MKLEPCIISDTERLEYKEYSGGDDTVQMPCLISEGRKPISIAQIMERRLHAPEQYWKQEAFITGDAVALHPSGKFKIVLDAQPLHNLSSQNKINKGAIVLSEKEYESLEGLECAVEEYKKIISRPLLSKEVTTHPIWQALARNQEVLNQYAKMVFSKIKENNYPKGEKGMSIYLGSPQETPVLKAIYFSNIPIGSSITVTFHGLKTNSIIGVMHSNHE